MYGATVTEMTKAALVTELWGFPIGRYGCAPCKGGVF
jgi:hypothetical protein